MTASSQHTATHSSRAKCITNLELARVDQVPGNKSIYMYQDNEWGEGGREGGGGVGVWVGSMLLV